MTNNTKQVRVEEFYKEENGVVIHYWRFYGEETWRAETTPYKEVPYVDNLKKELKEE